MVSKPSMTFGRNGVRISVLCDILRWAQNLQWSIQKYHHSYSFLWNPFMQWLELINNVFLLRLVQVLILNSSLPRETTSIRSETRVTQQTLVKFSDWLVLRNSKSSKANKRNRRKTHACAPINFRLRCSDVSGCRFVTIYWFVASFILALQISWPSIKQVATRLCQVKIELPYFIPKQIVFPISATLIACYAPYFNRKLSVPEVHPTLDEFHSENASIVFLLRTQQSPVIWDLRSKSHYYCDVIVFEILCIQNIFRPD